MSTEQIQYRLIVMEINKKAKTTPMVRMQQRAKAIPSKQKHRMKNHYRSLRQKLPSGSLSLSRVRRRCGRHYWRI